MRTLIGLLFGTAGWLLVYSVSVRLGLGVLLLLLGIAVMAAEPKEGNQNAPTN